MPHLNNTGPKGEGAGTGRQLGKCRNSDPDSLNNLGKGRGLKRKSGGGIGKGQRLKSSKLFDNQNNKENEDCDSN
jgi:hypothetical protein